ncbi:alpha beta hydrolase fold protein [Colletotrichum karsti]|uniref:Alpha beta hydrolase fold protein n=1 Tax=Colletotrichum karsti TaxID=1095194 RepID=A0A9P6I1V8_9PEZI|nr:alpha beta hydrolase fold protein [Colletotrichum karsti]KAF9874252.1 alpha beta hydrolase fold protein [Colletotrichum karsti]
MPEIDKNAMLNNRDDIHYRMTICMQKHSAVIMDYSYHITSLENAADSLRIAYVDEQPASHLKGVIVLIHGFPQTSYQYRKVIGPLVSAGYRVVVPDYRGAGLSSKPDSDFRKTTMANDMILLLDYLKITDPVHIVGHDIGGMIAYAFATRHADRTASLVWGECPLPGTTAHEEDRTTHGVQQFHFLFHSVPDLPEALVSGREEIYLSHFFDKISHRRLAISKADLDHYVEMYSRPGALRCAFGVYRAFLTDARENREWIEQHGKCKVKSLGLSGGEGRHKETALEMFEEVHEEGSVQIAEVPGSGHYVAEENPDGFVQAILSFIKQ